MLFLNILAGVLLVLCLIIRWLPSETFPLFALLSLGVPFVIAVNVLFLVFWLFLKRRNALVSLVPLLASAFFLEPFFKFDDNSENLDTEAVSIMSFNTRGFNKNRQLNLENADSLILDFVTKENPDIVCFQEFYYKMKRSGELSQYPYKFIDFVYGEHRGKVIPALYSKHPIINVARVDFPKSANGAIYADILIEKDTVRLYNIHLQSFRIVPDFQSIEKQKYRQVITKMKRAMQLQKQQAGIIREHLAQSPYKTLIVGDFNATQFSNTYNTLAKGFSDSFFKAGKGFGRTYDLNGYPMRIDYILGDENFEFTSHTNYDNKYSDHYPVMAGFKLISNK